MPVWAALIGTLGYNVHRHRHGKSTLCSSARTRVPAPALEVALTVGLAWLVNHYRDGFNPKENA